MMFRSIEPPEMSDQEKVVIELLHSGEPFFILRASDFLTVPTLNKYIKHVEDYGPRDLFLHEALYMELNRVREWQTDNPEKVRFPNVLGVSRADTD